MKKMLDKPIVAIGSKVVVPARSPEQEDRLLTFDDELIDKLIGNFKKMSSVGDNVPLLYTHSEDPRNEAGKVVKLYKKKKGNKSWLFARVLVTDHKDGQKIGRAIQNVSPKIQFQYKNGANQEFDVAMTHLALTPRPIIPGQPGFEEPDLSFSLSLSMKDESMKMTALQLAMNPSFKPDDKVLEFGLPVPAMAKKAKKNNKPEEEKGEEEEMGYGKKDEEMANCGKMETKYGQDEDEEEMGYNKKEEKVDDDEEEMANKDEDEEEEEEDEEEMANDDEDDDDDDEEEMANDDDEEEMANDDEDEDDDGLSFGGNADEDEERDRRELAYALDMDARRGTDKNLRRAMMHFGPKKVLGYLNEALNKDKTEASFGPANAGAMRAMWAKVDSGAKRYKSFKRVGGAPGPYEVKGRKGGEWGELEEDRLQRKSPLKEGQTRTRQARKTSPDDARRSGDDKSYRDYDQDPEVAARQKSAFEAAKKRVSDRTKAERAAKRAEKQAQSKQEQPKQEQPKQEAPAKESRAESQPETKPESKGGGQEEAKKRKRSTGEKGETVFERSDGTKLPGILNKFRKAKGSDKQKEAYKEFTNNEGNIQGMTHGKIRALIDLYEKAGITDIRKPEGYDPNSKAWSDRSSTVFDKEHELSYENLLERIEHAQSVRDAAIEAIEQLKTKGFKPEKLKELREQINSPALFAHVMQGGVPTCLQTIDIALGFADSVDPYSSAALSHSYDPEKSASKNKIPGNQY